MTDTMHALIAATATITAGALIIWGGRCCLRESAFRCRWCGGLCDLAGRPVEGEPLVVRDGFCAACHERREMTEARIIAVGGEVRS